MTDKNLETNETMENTYSKFGFSKEEIEAYPTLRESVNKILEYNKQADDNVDKVMHIIQGMLRDGKNIFSIYLLLAKCMNFTSQVFCKDHTDFMEQVQKAHNFANDTIMPIFEQQNPDGAFDIRQMLFTASSIIEYLIWSEASGDITISENKAEQGNVTPFPSK